MAYIIQSSAWTIIFYINNCKELFNKLETDNIYDTNDLFAKVRQEPHKIDQDTWFNYLWNDKTNCNGNKISSYS